MVQSNPIIVLEAIIKLKYRYLSWVIAEFVTEPYDACLFRHISMA